MFCQNCMWQTPRESKTASVCLVKMIIRHARLSDKQDTQSNNTPVNRQVGNDQTPQITLVDGFSFRIVRWIFQCLMDGLCNFGQYDNPTCKIIRQTRYSVQQYSGKQASREWPDPPDYLVWGIFLYIVWWIFQFDGLSLVFVGFSCLPDGCLPEYPKKVRKNTKT